MMKMLLLVCSARCAPGAVLCLFCILTWPTQALRTGLVRTYVSSWAKRALEKAAVPLCSEVERKVDLKELEDEVICNMHGSCWLAWTCQPCGNRICKILFWQCHLLFICCDYVSCTHFYSKFRIHIKRIKFTSQFCSSEIIIILDKSDSTFCVHVCVFSQYKMVTHFCFTFYFVSCW